MGLKNGSWRFSLYRHLTLHECVLVLTTTPYFVNIAGAQAYSKAFHLQCGKKSPCIHIFGNLYEIVYRMHG